MSTPTPARAAAATPTTADRKGRRGSKSGAAPNSAASASFRTPTTTVGGAAGRRTPGTARTPHARAALLALDNRRAAILTPGGRQSRRKSGRYLRESPRDLLRNLSRRLAPMSQPIASSSSSSSPAFSPDAGGAASGGRKRRGSRAAAREGRMSSYLDDDDDDDDSIPLDRPRMSLPIDDDNDDDLRPHRSMLLEAEDDEDGDEDENLTMRSIELARRMATQEQLQQARRFSRGSLGRSSFGSMQMSDYIDGFIGGADDPEQDERVRSAFFPEDAFDNLANEQPSEDITFERLDSDVERRDTLAAGRESGFGPIDVPLDGNETTFLLAPEGTEPAADDTAGPGFGDDADQDGPDPEPEPFDYDGGGNSPGVWMDEPENQEEMREEEEGEEEAAARDRMEAAAMDAAIDAIGKTTRTDPSTARHAGSRGKRIQLSRHGIPYPSLPVGVIKRVAQTFAQSSGVGKAKLSPETVVALSTASDWFFEQVGIDLGRYAKHAGRKTIDESDMLLLMKRQRQVNAAATPFSLAQRFLPRELLQELRMVPEAPVRKSRPKQRRSRMSAAGPPTTSSQGRDVT